MDEVKLSHGYLYTNVTQATSKLSGLLLRSDLDINVSSSTAFAESRVLPPVLACDSHVCA